MEKLFFMDINTNKNIAIIGDSHGCYYELKTLIEIIWDKYGKDTLIISVGDNIDRGDYNIKTLEYTISLYKEKKYLEVKSNHLDKFVRWLKGNNVKVSYGLQKTVSEFECLSLDKQKSLRNQVINYYENLPLYIIINKKVVVAHAGIKDSMIGKVSKEIKKFVLYGAITGKKLANGFPERLDWTKWRKDDNKNLPKIVYGHQVYETPYINNNCYGIDTGCVLGNKLTAYLPFLDKFEQVKAKKQYYSFEE